MIEKLKIKDFDKIYHLMEKSFPSDEYRTYEEQKTLLNNYGYSVYVLYDESQDIKAFIAVWEFNKFAYIEHFVVNPEHRNGGLGTNMLNGLVELLGKTVCLEVEPPNTEMASRRIGFYKRNNFFLNEYPYMQPPISQGKNTIPLFIMTSGSKVDEETFEQIKGTLYTKVYKCI
ncbi:MAG: GNAT family N-acetyltransferase [Clostridiales bacterium]|nr:GNAT family N-acetyltransferase [Clostridiales bacterium]